jgi:hypothetical protein
LRRLLVALACLLVAPASADAAFVVSYEAHGVSYFAAADERNDLTISLADGVYRVADEGATIQPGEGCRLTDGSGRRAECDVLGDGPQALVQLEDGDDRARVSLPAVQRNLFKRVRVSGGPGDDRLEGGGTVDELDGAEGTDELIGAGEADVLTGGFGDDRLEGGADFFTTLYVFDGCPQPCTPPAADRLDGGPGADTISGGSGVADSVSYRGRPAPVRVTFDDVRDDGEPGEGDLVGSDVESAEGGNGDDTLVGTPAANALEGRAGNDVLIGNGGFHDALFGGSGDDTLYLHDGEPEGTGTRAVFPTVATLYDDTFDCDSPPRGEAAGTNDLVLADLGDASALDGRLRGCETVLFSEDGVKVGPNTTSTLAEVACPVLQPVASCTGQLALNVPLRAPARRVAPAAFRPPERWYTLGASAFKARRAGRRVRVTLSSKGRRYLRKHGRKRAYPTVRFRRAR